MDPGKVVVGLLLGREFHAAVLAGEGLQVPVDGLEVVFELAFLSEGLGANTALEVLELFVHCLDVNLQMILLLEVFATELTLEPITFGAMLVVHVPDQAGPSSERPFADLALESLDVRVDRQHVGHQVGPARHLAANSTNPLNLGPIEDKIENPLWFRQLSLGDIIMKRT